jgi:hypothetical protein
MYFSRAKYVQFKRTLVLSSAICALLYLFSPVQLSEILCLCLSTGLRALPSVSTDGPLFQLLRGYFCVPAGQHIMTGTEWNLFYHLGGNGPWIPKVDGVIHETLAPPTSCVVDQVHMVRSSLFF